MFTQQTAYKQLLELLQVQNYHFTSKLLFHSYFLKPLSKQTNILSSLLVLFNSNSTKLFGYLTLMFPQKFDFIGSKYTDAKK